MIGDPIDPAPFLPAMPDAVRAVIERARVEKTAITVWMTAKGRGWGQVGNTLTLLRDKKQSAELTGWLAGIAMFGDDTDRLVDALEGHDGVLHALEAFAAGIAAGVAPLPGQWERIERLTAFGHPPALVEVVAKACASEDKPTRTIAVRLARKLGGIARDALERERKDSKGGSKRRLTNAASKLDDERGAQLLRLLDGWRATRSNELASAIEFLGLELGRLRGGALTAKSREALEEAWVDLARDRDPRDVDRLLATSWPKLLDHARKRVDMFAKFPPDPRILRGIAVAATRHRSDSSLRFHRAVADLFAETPVPELEKAIDTIIKSHDCAEIVEIYDDALSAARAIKPSAPHPSVLDDAAKVLRAQADLDALWATHCTDPGDLAHRAVLADALQATGDPRGELIALQLAPELDAAAKKRVAELLAAHADEWTGPIPMVSKSARKFERGFIVKLSCRAVGNELVATFDRPEWVTVEDLFIDGANCPLARLIKRMPLLRRLATPHGELLAQLARTGNYPQIEALACERGWLPPSDRFTGLRVMAGKWDDNAIADAHADAAIRGLHAIVHLGISPQSAQVVLSHLKRAPPEVRIAIGGSFVGFDTDGWRIRVVRDRGIAELAWGGGSSELKRLRAEVETALAMTRLDVHEVKKIELA